jgi:hypothetical protein
MGHFAKVVNGVVTQVIVAEPDFFDTFVDTTPGEWIQTSYNTYAGEHTKGGTPLRKNFAGVGYLYMSNIDAFVPPKPYPSWILDEDRGVWNAPVERPNDGEQYSWDETNGEWVQISRS